MQLLGEPWPSARMPCLLRLQSGTDNIAILSAGAKCHGVFARALDLILDGGRGLSIAIAIFRNLDLECDPLEFGVRILILRPIFSFRVAVCVF